MADIKWPRTFRRATELPAAQVAALVEQLIAELDRRDGDTDVELNGDEEDDPGDLKDTAFPEWHTRGRHKLYGGKWEHPNGMGEHVAQEDSEDDDPDTSAEDAPAGFDPEQDMCTAGDDGVFSGSATLHDVMRPDYGPGDSVDEERDQMEQDVPCIPIVSLEPNIFNGQRQLLGYTLPRPTRDGMEPEL